MGAQLATLLEIRLQSQFVCADDNALRQQEFSRRFISAEGRKPEVASVPRRWGSGVLSTKARKAAHLSPSGWVEGFTVYSD